MTSYPDRQVSHLFWTPECNLTNNSGFTLHVAASHFNVALSGTAIQSTTHSIQGNAEHTNDGNSDPQWEHYSCSLTQYKGKQWWRLELPGVYQVSEIQVTNRNAYREYLNGLEILIGNSLANNGNDNPRWFICVTCPTITQYWSTPSQNVLGGSTMTSTCF